MSVEDVLPWLYLKGISTEDFREALQALLCDEAKGLSASTISRLKRIWEEEHETWSRRSLKNKRYVYIWADGVYFTIRSDDAKQCIVVVIGVTDQGIGLQVFWLLTFAVFGRSTVTTSTLSFQLIREHL